MSRADAAITPASVTFTVVGSKSGTHIGRTMVVNEGRAILFRPALPFEWAEVVDVKIAASAPLDPGVLGANAHLSFSIASGAVAMPPAPTGPETDPLDRLSRGSAAQRAQAAETSTLPPDFPVITSTLYATPSPGLLFMSSLPFVLPGTPYTMIVDNYGNPLFYRSSPGFCTDFKVQPDGHLTYFDTIAAKFYVLDSTYTAVDSLQCGNGYSTDVHELRLVQNGHALLLGLDPETVDMRTVVVGGDSAATVEGLIIQELDADKNVVFQWRSWDHFQITDATHEDLTASTIDYVHGNALDIDTDGNLLLSSRHLDEITKIDRTTGDIIWRMGGKNNQFTLVGDTLWYSHQHAIRRIANGDVTLFDNGNYHSPPFSRAVEYSLDEVNHTLQRVWEYRNTPDSYGYAMGFVERLPNGSTLVSWGTGKPDLIEVAPNGSKVMELSLPANVSSYRIFRQDWGNNAVAGASAPAPRAVSLSANWPNPFRTATELSVSERGGAAPSFQTVDVLGREVHPQYRIVTQGPGQYLVRIDLGAFPAGVYFFRASTSAGAQTRRIVHLN